MAVVMLLPVMPLRAPETFAAVPDSLHRSLSGISRTLLADLRLTGRDAVRLATAPARWREQEWSALILLAAAAGIVAGNDRTAGQMALATRSEETMQVLSPFEYYGRRQTGFSIAGALYLGGLLSRNDELRMTGRCALAALLLSAVQTSAIKEMVGRARPSAGHGPATFRPFSFRESYRSMPSGHTTAAFALSAAIASRIRKPAVAAAFYAAAALTAVQRVYAGQHWPSDVVAGAVIGTVTGVLAARAGDVTSSDRRSHRYGLRPITAGSAAGCGMTVVF